MAKKSKASKKHRRKKLSKKNRDKRSTESMAYVPLEPKHLLAAITVGNATDLSNAPDTSSITALIANDGGDGISLREAIAAANRTVGEDTITFDGSVFTSGNNSLIRLTQGELVIEDSLSIDGSSVGGVVITGDANGDDITVAGTYITDVSASSNLNDNSRVIYFSEVSHDLSLTGVTITGGRTSIANDGGGIHFDSNGTLTLNQSTISGNSSGESGGGIYATRGNVSLVGSTVSGNRSNEDGGGIYASRSSVSLLSSTVSGNSSANDGGGIHSVRDSLSLVSSTVSGNRTTGFGSGGGIYSRGGLSLANSTVTDNSATFGMGGGINTSGVDFIIHNSIVAGNSLAGFGTAPDLFTTSYVANNLGLANSLIGDTSGSSITATTGSRNILDQAALLGPLADNGGPTLTHALLPGSPAINAGRNSLVAVGNDTDQRGEARIVGGTVDIGAFESEFDDPMPSDPVILVVGNNTDVVSPTADTSSATALIANDGGDGISLREAIAAANGTQAETAITFDASVFTGGSNSLIRLTEGEFEINDSLTIDGSSVAGVVITGDIDGDDVVIPGTYITDPNTSTNSLLDNVRVLNFSATSGDLNLTGVTITGGGSYSNVGGVGIYFDSGGTLALNQSTLSGNISSFGDGGAISTIDGDVVVTDSTVSGNRSTREQGGGIHTVTGSVSLINSTLSGNRSDNAGGGIFTDSGDVSLTNSTVSGNQSDTSGGGIVTISGEVSLFNSTVSGNSGGSSIGSNQGNVSLTDSTVSGNLGGGIAIGFGNLLLFSSAVSGNLGGGIASGFGNVLLSSSTVSENLGGGISSGEGNVSLTNSTVSGNITSADGGGIFSETSSIQLVNSTVANNSAGGVGGGIGFRDDRFDQRLTLQNSIVANNVANGAASDLFFVTDVTNELIVDYSLIGDTTGSGITATTGTGNILNQLLLLGPLADNGGPTLTHALPSSSLAVDAGSNALASAAGLTTDQRGEDRVLPATVDIGAVEQGDLQNDLLLFVTQLADENDASDLNINTFDFSDLSLREAITLTNGTPGNSTIFFEIPGPVGAPQVITIGSQLFISSSVTIEGPGADLLTIDAQGGGDNVLDGNGFQILEVNDGDANNSIEVSISGLTLTGGDNNNDSGGAISNFENLSLDGVSIVDNRASFGGGVNSDPSGVLTITNSTIANNEANQDGGGISAGGELVLSNATLLGNSAVGDGGGISTGGALVATNVTISGNSAAGNGGAIIAAGNISGATLNLTHSTLTNNTGINEVHFSNVDGPTTATFNNTIIDGSVTGVGNNGTSLVGGYNLFATDDPGITGTANLFNQTSRLGPLADNGGSTLTHALLSGSPAVNAGSNALSVDEDGNPLTTDQRGEERVRFGAVDIGALETEFQETASLVVNMNVDADNRFDGFTSIRDAIAFANDPTAGVNGDGDADGDGLASDTITFDASVFTGGDNNLIRLTLGELTISNGLTIDGSSVGGVVITGDSNDDDVTLPGTHITDLAASFGATTGAEDDLLDDNSRVLTIYNASFDTPGDVTLTGLTITGGRVTDMFEGGGGIKFDSFADLTLNQVTVSGNSAADPTSISGYGLPGGGGILANGDLYLIGSSVTGNISGSIGGGIRGGSSVRLTDSSVIGNYSAFSGGGIRGGSVSLTDSTVSGNSSGSGGGGISAGGDISLTASIVSDNIAGFSGGGIFSGSGDVSLTNSIVSDNSTVGEGRLFFGGGGIYADFGDVSLTNSIVSGNSTDGDGGGIYARFGDVVLIDNSIVSDNSSPAVGGGIYTNFGDAVLRSSTVSGNSSGSRGGGIFTNDLSLTDSTVNANSAGGNGGGIIAGDVSLTNSTVNANSASGNGGGVRGSSVSLTNSTVSGNSSLIDGGGISGSNLSLINSTVSGNSSAGEGGGIAAAFSILLVNSTVTDNSAAEVGGGIRLNSSNVEEPLVFHNSIVAGNTDNGTAPDVDAVGEVINGLFVEHSLIGDTSGSGISVTTGTGNILNQLPLLGPLADNGGPTQTHALLPGSPALDAGDDTLALNVNLPLATDQRGGVFVRSFDDPIASGTGVDIGAFELHALLVDNPVDEDDGNVAAGDLSLREAIRLANDSPLLNTITFDTTVFTGGDNSLIRLTQGELVISETLSIDGTSVGGIVITGDANDDDVTLPGTNITDVSASYRGSNINPSLNRLDDNSRVLNFSGGSGNLTLTSLTVTGGRTRTLRSGGGGIRFAGNGALSLNQSIISGNSGGGERNSGAAIRSYFGNVYLTNSSVSRNSITSEDGRGGGISTDSASVFLTDSTISENSTVSEYGIFSDLSRGGGINTRSGSVFLTNSTVSDNSSRGYGGGIVSLYGDVSLVNSTVSGNRTLRSFSSGGGIFTRTGDVTSASSTISGNSTAGNGSDGGGIYSYSGSISLIQSTISGNSTADTNSRGGGIFTVDSTVLILNSTVAGNSSGGVGGGIGLLADNFNDDERLILRNSIVAGNSDNGTAPDLLAVGDVMNDLIVEHSLIGDTTGSGIIAAPGTGNILDQAALLGPLADNGGLTQTHALLPGSPAIDTGNNALALDENGNPLITDQLGETRIVGAVDIGAVETPFDGVRSLVVTTNQDVVNPSDGVTSLREAIAFTNLIFSSAGDSDTITFDASVFTGGDNSLIRLTQGELAISDSLIIDGSSAVGVVITGDADDDDITVAGTHITDVSASFGGTAGDADDLLDDNSRVINFFSEEGNLSLTGLTLTGGRITEDNRNIPGQETANSGGGIRFDSNGNLTLSINLSGNSTSDAGSDGGGVFSSGGYVSLVNSTVSGNSVTGYFSGEGGGIFAAGDVSLINSTVSGNFGGGISTRFGNVSLSSSNVSGNTSDGNGGGIATYSGDVSLNNSTVSLNVSGDNGGGIHTSSGDVSLTSDSSVSANIASDNGGGIHTFTGDISLTSNSSANENISGGEGGGISSAYSGVVSLSNSTVSGNSTLYTGGGISASSGSVLLTNSTVSGNSTTSFRNGGGIYADSGNVLLIGSSVSGNTSEGHGGGISTFDGNISLNNSTVSGNTAVGYAGGVGSSAGDITLTNSTLSENSARSGGGIYVPSSIVTLTNSTLSGNTASEMGGGIIVLAAEGFFSSGSTLSLVNSTIVGNSADTGGGISFVRSNPQFFNAPVRLTIANSILADNIDNIGAPDLSVGDVTLSSLIVERSLIGDTNGSGISATTGTGNILDQPALLGPLADNGGPTQTHTLLPGSPAIDAGDNALAVDENGNALTTDQRGEDRIQSGTVDIGAVESESEGPFLLGDADLSGVVDFADIPAFIDVLLSGVFLDEADIDRDGDIDFADIPAFIDALLSGGPPQFLLGDADLSGVVDFADIPAFIDVLLSGTFLDEADVNRDGIVDFADIPAFIDVLLNGGSPQVLLGDADLSGVVDFADIPAFIDVLLSGVFLDEADVDRSGVVDFADIPAFINALLSGGSSAVTSQSIVLAPPVSSAASLVSVSEPESIASVASTVDVPLTTETSDAIAEPAELVEYDSLEPVEATDPIEIVPLPKSTPDQMASTESTSVEAIQFSTAESLPPVVAPDLNPSTNKLLSAPVLASAVEYRLPERQAVGSFTPPSLVGGEASFESRVENRQFLANDSDSDQQETGVADLLDETFSTYEDDLDVVFS